MIDLYTFYFIHIAKCAGTAILCQLPKDYLNKYYNEYHKRDSRLKHLDFKKYPHIQRVSLDHLTLQEAFDIKIIGNYDLTNKDFVVIWRNPIHRFISICNHFKITPNILINRLKKPKNDPIIKTGMGRKSWYMTTNDILKINGRRIKSVDLLLDDFDSIIQYFKTQGIKIINHNPSHCNNIYSVKDLTEQQLNFVKNFYKEDIIIYNNLLKKFKKI